MARVPLKPLNGTEVERQAALPFIDPDELNATTDQHRLFLGDIPIGPVWLGVVASEAEMTDLFNTHPRGCFPGDECYRSDSRTFYKCVTRFGLDVEDWLALFTTSTDVTLGGGAPSDDLIPTQKAVKAYADALLAASEAMVFKGAINCSGNPNYPAADAGHVYKISVAGKIGGAAGVNVEAGDSLYCVTDTVAGTQAAVGANWVVLQVNIDGAVIGPVSATNNRVAIFDGATGKLLADSGVLISALVQAGVITAVGLTMDVGIVGRYDGGVGALQKITLGANLNLSGAGILSAAAAGATLDARDVWMFS